MNILFLTMNVFTDIEMHNIYSDLMKELIARGHRPFIVTPREKKTGEKTQRTDYADYTLLKVQIGNTSDVSLIEKGISTVTLSSRYFHAIKKELGGEHFDLILYSTPPITLAGPVKKLKHLFNCRTYLMLKDIFPQNAVDLGMFGQNSLICRYFRRQEKLLYRVSDRIGCMSDANVEYLLKHNPEIPKEKAELCPNGVIPHEVSCRERDMASLREKLGVPKDAVVYLFGGNLGKPQGIPQLIECLRQSADRSDCFFVICGSGSEAGLLESFIKEEAPSNVRLFSLLPKEEYDSLCRGCDVGMVFLDSRFTIPNYPSRVLTYMEYEIPVLVCSDPVSDLGKTAADNGFGCFCRSDDPSAFSACLDTLCQADRKQMGRAARAYLASHFTAAVACAAVLGEAE